LMRLFLPYPDRSPLLPPFVGIRHGNSSIGWKVAIINGATSAIGRLTAVFFAREGAKLVLADIRDEASYITGQALPVDEGNAASLNLPGRKV
jgi:hypothetical protein